VIGVDCEDDKERLWECKAGKRARYGSSEGNGSDDCADGIEAEGLILAVFRAWRRGVLSGLGAISRASRVAALREASEAFRWLKGDKATTN
jgi:hypothetical protein